MKKLQVEHRTCRCKTYDSTYVDIDSSYCFTRLFVQQFHHILDGAASWLSSVKLSKSFRRQIRCSAAARRMSRAPKLSQWGSGHSDTVAAGRKTSWPASCASLSTANSRVCLRGRTSSSSSIYRMSGSNSTEWTCSQSLFTHRDWYDALSITMTLLGDMFGNRAVFF